MTSVRSSQDAERIERQALAHRLRVAPNVAEHGREAVLALGVEQDGPQLALDRLAAFLHRPPAAPRGQMLLHDEHRHDALGRNEVACGSHLAAEPNHQAAQEPHGAFGALGIATEPEQVIGRAARQIAAAAVQALIRLALREQAELLHRLIGQHPGVLAHVAGFEPRRTRIGPDRDPRQPPRHHLVAVLGGGHVDAQGDRCGLEAARTGPGRRHRQRRGLLTDEIVTAALDLTNQALALLCRRVGHDEAALPRREQISRGRDAAHDQLVEVTQHVLALARLAAPPGRDARNRKLLVEVEPAQARQEAQESVALDEAAAERIADRHLAGARRLQQPRHPDERIRAQLERIAELGADSAHDQVDGLQTLRPSSSNTRSSRTVRSEPSTTLKPR